MTFLVQHEVMETVLVVVMGLVHIWNLHQHPAIVQVFAIVIQLIFSLGYDLF